MYRRRDRYKSVAHSERVLNFIGEHYEELRNRALVVAGIRGSGDRDIRGAISGGGIRGSGSVGAGMVGVAGGGRGVCSYDFGDVFGDTIVFVCRDTRCWDYSEADLTTYFLGKFRMIMIQNRLDRISESLQYLSDYVNDGDYILSGKDC